MTHKIVSCMQSDSDRILAIINDAAEAYRGVIPDACFHQPYMSAQELQSELAAGINFSGCVGDNQLFAVMGIQDVRDVTLIRHAYVDPKSQRTGAGAALLDHLKSQTKKPILIGTWKAATWAIAFYRKHGFTLAGDDEIRPLLKRYWTVPETQIVNSCVLVDERYRKGVTATLT